MHAEGSRAAREAKDEEEPLMPGSAPLPALRRLDDLPGHNHSRRYGTNQSEHEYAALVDQLRALEHDIGDARKVSRRARQTPTLTPHAGHDATPPPPPPRGEAIVLRDGSAVLIRPVEPADAGQLDAVFKHLGELTRYRCFLTPIDHLTARQLYFLTHVDHTEHEALMALDATSGEGIGIARCVRDPHDARQAEVVVVVTDPWQGRGVGTALAARLSAHARATGVDRLTARMLIGNQAGHRLVERVADPVSSLEDGGTVRLTFRLRGARATLPDLTRTFQTTEA